MFALELEFAFALLDEFLNGNVVVWQGGELVVAFIDYWATSLVG